MDYLDILVFAAITVFILARLWAVLGRRHDDEPERTNPFSAPASRGQDEEDVVVLSDRTHKSESPLAAPQRFAPSSLAGVLEQIKAASSSFDEKQFLQGAKTAFTRIVEGFAKGDLSGIDRWLAPQVRQSFQNAIAMRQAAGQTLESHLDHFGDADISAARLEGSIAFLTVTFKSFQTNVTRDAKGNVVSGVPGQLEEVHDVWIFKRDLQSDDPNWLLAETRS